MVPFPKALFLWAWLTHAAPQYGPCERPYAPRMAVLFPFCGRNRIGAYRDQSTDLRLSTISTRSSRPRMASTTTALNTKVSRKAYR